MKQNNSNWSPKKLEAYIYLFFRHSDYTNQNTPIDLNQLRVNQIEFNEIQKEFNTDNDYQSIQKICAMVEIGIVSRKQLLVLMKVAKSKLTLLENKNQMFTNNICQGLERILFKAA